MNVGPTTPEEVVTMARGERLEAKEQAEQVAGRFDLRNERRGVLYRLAGWWLRGPRRRRAMGAAVDASVENVEAIAGRSFPLGRSPALPRREAFANAVATLANKALPATLLEPHTNILAVGDRVTIAARDVDVVMVRVDAITDEPRRVQITFERRRGFNEDLAFLGRHA